MQIIKSLTEWNGLPNVFLWQFPNIEEQVPSILNNIMQETHENPIQQGQPQGPIEGMQAIPNNNPIQQGQPGSIEEMQATPNNNSVQQGQPGSIKGMQATPNNNPIQQWQPQPNQQGQPQGPQQSPPLLTNMTMSSGVFTLSGVPVLGKRKLFKNWQYLVKEGDLMVWTSAFLQGKGDEERIPEIYVLFKEIKQDWKQNKKKYWGVEWLAMLRDRVIIEGSDHLYLKITIYLMWQNIESLIMT